MEPSPRQREILEFVNTHVDAHGYPPTVREIGQAVGLTSPSTVHAHLARLEESGLIADEQIEDTMAVPDQLCTDADFLLTIKGDSMINAGILDGDFVVVRKQDDARNGEIVVALMGDEDATVKRFFRESGRVRLQPDNDDMEPMYPEQVKVLGTVRAVLRRL